MKNKKADERKNKKKLVLPRYYASNTCSLWKRDERESGRGSRREKETSNESKEEMRSELAILHKTDSYAQLLLLLVLFLFLR